MVDLSEAAAPKSDQANADDFIPPGPAGARNFTVTKVDFRPGTDQPISIHLAEFQDGRPFKPAKTVVKLLILAWGPESDNWVGKRLTLFNDPKIKWAGKEIGGIRVSHVSGISKAVTANLNETTGKKALHRIEPLSEKVPPAREAGPMDRLVWAFNAAKIPTEDRLDYCMNVVGHELDSAADLTEVEIGTVVESLQQAIAYEREQEQTNG